MNFVLYDKKRNACYACIPNRDFTATEMFFPCYNEYGGRKTCGSAHIFSENEKSDVMKMESVLKRYSNLIKIPYNVGCNCFAIGRWNCYA